MKKSLGRFHSLVVPLLTWLVLLIPFAFYQRYYVGSQQAYLTEHGFRLLSAVGRALDSYLDSIDKTVNAAERLAEAARNNTSVPQQAPVGGQKAEKPLPADADYLSSALLDLDITPEDFATKDGPFPNSLSVEFGPRPAGFQWTFKTLFAGRLSLDDAIRERLAGIGEDYFDDVLITDPQGLVLFQRSRDTRITSLDYLVRTATDNSAPASSAATKPAADNKDSKDNKDSPRPQSSPFEARSESSTVLTVTLAGAEYKLFLQPLVLPLAGMGAKDTRKLVLCGLWRAERLDSSSFALPYSYVIWFGLACAAVSSFAWPFLKINYMSNTERLRRSHGWLLALSLFLGTAAVTLMALNVSYATHAGNNIDADLKTLARSIQANVDQELGRAVKQLSQLSQNPEVLQRATRDDRTKTGLLSPPASNIEYPYFDIAFWTDGQGKQLVKDTVDLYYTPRTPVGNYRFFQDVMAQVNPANPSKVPLLARLNEKFYALQPLTSPNTGQFHAVIAAPFDGPSADTKIKVQVLVTRPLSLVNALLPPDFGFAVLDNDGMVQFHSNPRRNLSEDFVAECKDPEALRAALFSESDQLLDLEYSGQEQRALVTKINHLGPAPATLIVFHNSEIDLTIRMAIVLIVSVLLAFYTAGILLMAAIDLLRGRKYPPTSIWPRKESSVRYALVFAFNSLLALVFFLWYSHLTELDLLELIAGILVSAILWLLFLRTERAWFAPNKRTQALEKRFQSTYIAAAVSLLVVMTVVPCFGFFKFAHDAASEIAARHGQVRALEAVLSRRARISAFYHKLQAPQTLAAKQISEDLDRYDRVDLKFLSFAGRTVIEPSSDSALQVDLDSLLERMTHWFPANTLGSEMRMLKFASTALPPAGVGAAPAESGASRPIAQALSWHELTENTFRLQWLGDPQTPQGQPVPTVDSMFAKWEGVAPAGWFVLGLLCLLLIGWFFLLMKKIFLAVGQPPAPYPPFDPEDCSVIQESFLVLGDPRSGKSGRLNRIPGIHYFDLRIEAGPHETRGFSHESVVALDHFDFSLDNTVRNQALLKLLERLIYKDRCHVILTSSTDPVYYFSEGASSILADNPDQAADLLDRWTRVMNAFQKVNFVDPHKAAFDELVNRPDLRNQPLIRWMKEECSHTAYLRSFGMLLYQRQQPFDPLQAGAELVEYAESYYSVLWSTLSAREHLVLYQLAEDGWANTKNDRAIRQLQRKGLILSAPMLRIMNTSFRDFVHKAQDQREIAEWEQQGRQSSWRSVKIVFIATAVGLGAWLFYAQKDLLQVSIGYVVTFGAAITAIANALSGLRGRSGSAPKAS